jgi:hypothetical protein
VAVVVSIARGHDASYPFKTVGAAEGPVITGERGAGYYLSAVEKGGEPGGMWVGNGAAELGFHDGDVVRREDFEPLYGQFLDPRDSSRQTYLGSPPRVNAELAAIYQAKLAAHPGATADERMRLPDEARAEYEGPVGVQYFDTTFSVDKTISLAHASEVPTGRGITRLASDATTGRCAHCGRAFRRRTDGTLTVHDAGGQRCPGGGQPPAEDTALATWLPVRPGLTPHGLRHGHQTWMEEAAISDLLRSERMGHEVPGMRGVYGHVSPAMRADLKAALQERWESSLRERAAATAINRAASGCALDRSAGASDQDRLPFCSQNRTSASLPVRREEYKWALT